MRRKLSTQQIYEANYYLWFGSFIFGQKARKAWRTRQIGFSRKKWAHRVKAGKWGRSFIYVIGLRKRWIVFRW